jgi:hypothetical protein
MAAADDRMPEGERHVLYLAILGVGLVVLLMPVPFQFMYLCGALPAWWQAR